MLIANTLVPWTSEWLAYYEAWLTTGGEWLGGGVHDEATGNVIPAKAETATRRRADYLGRKEARLERVLRSVYGQDCDAEELLHNAHLAPST
jgi:hypothetical protein